MKKPEESIWWVPDEQQPGYGHVQSMPPAQYQKSGCIEFIPASSLSSTYGHGFAEGYRQGLKDQIEIKKLKEFNPQTQEFLRHLVDIVWNEVTESEEVPSTAWADELIKRAYGKA